MPEITIRDLCRWDRRLSLLPSAGVALESSQERGVSWAVSVRAAPPLLPPLRGDELVVLPLRVLEQIESTNTITRAELLATLAQQKIAALLTEPGFTEESIDSLTVLTLPAPFPHDAEGTLNRMLTERRGELYRLGTELSRRLSGSALDPRGVEALLESAAELSGRALVLQDTDGNMVAWSGNGAGQAEMASPDAMNAARQTVGPVLLPEGSNTERLIIALAAGGRSGYLSTLGPLGTLTESDRLVLSQTASTCSIVLSQQGRIGTVERSGRQRLVADLLLGRLASDAAAMARGQMLGIDPSTPLVVGLIEAPDGAPQAREIVISTLGQTKGENIAAIPGGVGVLLPGADPESVARAMRRTLSRPIYEGVSVALSRPVSGVIHAAEGVREARFALDLRKTGALTDQVVSCASVNDMGIYGLLFPIWRDSIIAQFRSDLLGPLEAYDGRRSTHLIETLEAYLSYGGALAEAAANLGVHRNTLSYRLQRIEDLIGRDLSDARFRLLLQVALLTRRLPQEGTVVAE